MPRSSPFSHTFLALILKFLNFLQLFIGLSIIVYSWYMLNQWNNNNNNNPYDPPPPPQPPLSPSPFPYNYNNNNHYYHNEFAAIALSVFNHGIRLPAPWFIFAFMGLGIALCSVTCIGHIAAETINGCCLSFYTFLSAILILMEATFVAFITLDHHWEKDLPFDPTGELDHFRNLIEENIEIATWVGVIVLIIQALSLLISLLLRAMVSTQNSNSDDVEGDCNSSNAKTWEPLLNQGSGSIAGDSIAPISDTWSSRMRKKYGLNKSNSSN